MSKKITNFLIVLFSIFCLTGCSYLTSNCPTADVPHRPTLESAHKIRKDIIYEYENENGTTKVKTLKKDGLYLNRQDVKELKHYIDSMQNELQDLQ